jgi:nucleoside-diphosphate-sugar epimerase
MPSHAHKPPEKSVVLVTGSSGFIGAAVCAALARGFEVVGLDQVPPSKSSQIPWLKTDITSDQSVGDALQKVRQEHGARVASVIHLAAYYDFSGEPSPLYEQITVRGTERLLRSLRQSFEAIEQFVFSSTMLVHAPCKPGQKINEDWPLLAKWDYPASKLETEKLIAVERGAVPAALLRIAGVYDDQCHSIPIAHQIQRIYERELTAKVFPGDTSTGQAFVHLDALVDAIERVVNERAKLPSESVFLIGEEQTLSYDELQRMLGWLIHQEPEWETTQIPKAVAKSGAWIQDNIPGVAEPFIKPWMIDLADDHYRLDINRAGKLLGWEPKRSLRETLARMVAALKSDPVAFYRLNKLESAPPVPAESAAAPAPRSD